MSGVSLQLWGVKTGYSMGYPSNRGLPPAGYPSNRVTPRGLPLQPGYPPRVTPPTSCGRAGYPSKWWARVGYPPHPRVIPPGGLPLHARPSHGLPPQGWVTPPTELSVRELARRVTMRSNCHLGAPRSGSHTITLLDSFSDGWSDSMGVYTRLAAFERGLNERSTVQYYGGFTTNHVVIGLPVPLISRVFDPGCFF